MCLGDSDFFCCKTDCIRDREERSGDCCRFSTREKKKRSSSARKQSVTGQRVKPILSTKGQSKKRDLIMSEPVPATTVSKEIETKTSMPAVLPPVTTTTTPVQSTTTTIQAKINESVLSTKQMKSIHLAAKRIKENEKRQTKHDKDRIEISEEALQKLKDLHAAKEPAKKKKRMSTGSKQKAKAAKLLMDTGGKWTKQEDSALRKGVEALGAKNWKRIAVEFLGGARSEVQCMHRWKKALKPGLVKGRWTDEEDDTIINCIKAGVTKWSEIAERTSSYSSSQNNCCCCQLTHTHTHSNSKQEFPGE